MKLHFANFDSKWLGITISILSIALLFILASFSIKIAKLEAAACVHPGGGQCPITAHIPPVSYLGAVLIVVIFILGIKLMLKTGVAEKMQKEVADKAKMFARALKGDEKKAYELILASQGVIFQSELVEKMGYSKVKVSRILDKLEGQNLIERRRRGLANIVLIKYR